MKSADPLDNDVKAWWKAKADEIYKIIPDFGGFLVKANSEGQPGPKDYGRNHAEGANVMADALAPHGGTVIWRAFVYDEEIDADRAKRAYIEFTRLDGQFRPNVMIQVKNGAIDFMPREPFHPLFGALKQTPVMAEVQATQEYLGQAKHLVYLGTMWKEFLDADTYAKGKGSTVGKVVEGSVHPYRVTESLRLQSGTQCQLVWTPFFAIELVCSRAPGRGITNSAPAQIAEEWTRMTFTNDSRGGQDNHRSDDELTRGLCELHHAARLASFDWWGPLCADASERPRATCRLDCRLLSSGIGGGHWLRPDDAWRQSCRAILPSGARYVR
jgi:alpha-glucuronidase